MSLFGKPKSPEELMYKAERDLARGDIAAFRNLVDQCIESYRSSGRHFDAGIQGLRTAKALNKCGAHDPVPHYCQSARQDFSEAGTRTFQPPDPDPNRAMQTATQYQSCFVNQGLCYLEEGYALYRLQTHPRSMKALHKARTMLQAWRMEEEAASAQLYWAGSLMSFAIDKVISHGADKASDRLLEKAITTLRSLKDEFMSMGDSRGAATCFIEMAGGLLILRRPQDVIDAFPEVRRLCEKSNDAFLLNQCRQDYKQALSLKDKLDG